MIASRMLHREKPFSPVPVMRLPTKPPRNAPTIPMRIVTMIPPGSGPGMSAFAIAPAISPSTIHATIPITSPPSDGVRRRTPLSQPPYQAEEKGWVSWLGGASLLPEEPAHSSVLHARIFQLELDVTLAMPER